MDLSTLTPVIPLFTASLLGSPHCALMCGGFVAMYSQGAESKPRKHLEYSLGRLATYLVLGLIAATAGRGLNSFELGVGIGNLSAVLVAVALTLSGLSLLLRGQSVVNKFWLTHTLAKGISSVVAPLIKKAAPAGKSPFLLGLVSTLLPCGWLYSYVAVALSSADVLAASIIMFVFWLGTLPLMLSLGAATRIATSKLGAKLPRLTGLLLIAAAALSLRSHLLPKCH